MTTQRTFTLVLSASLLALVAGCGGSPTAGGGIVPPGDSARLDAVWYGRLVDVYAYQVVDPDGRLDRRDRFNRRSVLVSRDVVVNPSLEGQTLFDVAGEERVDANYQFLPFDIRTGHEELLILWDNRSGPEARRFQDALDAAAQGLLELSPAFRDQSQATRPIPVLPRNAALKLEFDTELGVDADFFRVNPAAVQVLEFRAAPNAVSARDAFRALPFRAIPRGRDLILDTTILGGESSSNVSSSGLPPSVDNVTANIRVAIPSRGSSPFRIREDPVAELNGRDSQGRDAVIRDFRSGNTGDGRAGTLSDVAAPMIVADLGMGIVDIDRRTRTLTLNKRLHRAAVRGRYPFVEGPLDPGSGLPLGPAAVPTDRPLRKGDILYQDVESARADGSIEVVHLRAEILQNLDVGTVLGDPEFPELGLTRAGTQGHTNPTVRVRVASLLGADSVGNEVAFQAGGLHLGRDCTMRVHYYESVKRVGGGDPVSDADYRHEFLVVEPKPPAIDPNNNPVPLGTLVHPMAAVALRFSEPMDLSRVDSMRNLVLGNSTLPGPLFAELIDEPKPSSLSVLATRAVDLEHDGTVLELRPPLGHFHVTGNTEAYWFHLLLGSAGITDLSQNPVETFDDPLEPIENWSVDYTMDPDQGDNLVGSRIYPFQDIDEDGTPPGSVDLFGEFQLRDGKLIAADTIRFSRTADRQNLAGISRFDRGECFFPGSATLPPANLVPPTGGLLYLQPQMVDQTLTPPQVFPNVPEQVGRVIEPHQPRGSRMMMRYLEDDFGLAYQAPSEYLLDIEQLYWSPYNDDLVLFDVFDRYTMRLAHSDKRPDIRYTWFLDATGTPVCNMTCGTMNSGLSLEFTDNVLRGSDPVTVFEDVVYEINPNDAFRAPSTVKYVPYPEFTRSYTWRDYRLVNVENGELIGLGGARNPRGTPPAFDRTANIDSPWSPDAPTAGFNGARWVMDAADFAGNQRRDHDPIALPLLVDFLVFPDGAANGVASGINAFQVAMLGPPSNFTATPPFPGGYYNQTGAGCAPVYPPWPYLRVHTTGGIDPNTGQDILVDPANSAFATGGWVKDAGLGSGSQGLFPAPPGDGMMNWSQADFVRRVSAVTFGFFDTLQPNRHALDTSTLLTNWPGLSNPAGVPDFAALGVPLRVRDIVTLMDPSPSRQPPGTSVVLEFRGATDFANAELYDQALNDVFNTRGNLLNPNYACEAYRYDQPTWGPAFDTPRVDATGLTAYVTEDRLSEIADSRTGLLPRYLNLRLSMENNIAVTPALSLALNGIAIVFRMEAAQ